MIRASKDTASNRRQERKLIDSVRAQCVDRDGTCRVGRNLTLGFLGPCGGHPEWAHIGDFRRFKTRRMDPTFRHQSAHSAMLCGAHHDLYDAHVFDIQELTDQGADGPLAFVKGELRFEETDPA